LPHPANNLLVELRTAGAPVSFISAEWSNERILQAIRRGSHKSASEYLHFVENEMADFIQKLFWVVLPFEAVKHLPGLRLSPLGVVPQRDRRPRLIVDYTFSEVNQDTDKKAPREAMQFGRALDRVLRAILTADPRHGPVYMLKIDLSDGFYRIPVRPEDVQKLGVAFPTKPGEPYLVAFPCSLPMGWTESPPWFCAATETIVDLANSYCGTRWDPPQHPLERLASSAPAEEPSDRHVITVPAPSVSHTNLIPPLPPRPYRPRQHSSPLVHADVFVDDEILVAQGSHQRLNRVRRQLMHLNDRVMRPNDVGDEGGYRQEPMSVKKLKKGDAAWATYKTVLGWDIDSLRKTIELPPHRKARLLHILEQVQGRRRITHKEAYRLLGELRSMLLGISGAAGLFSLLQNALKTALRQKHRVRVTPHLAAFFADLHMLAKDVANRPTRIAELYPKAQEDVGGLTDACKHGLGGVIFPSPALGIPPIVWREPVPDDLQAAVVTEDNPHGTITNSDLELAATILQEALLGKFDIAEQTILTGCDNTPAVTWRHKGSNSLDGASAYLLRVASLLQRRLRHVPRLAYVPGIKNVLADIASRRFDWSHQQLVAYLNSFAPQTQSWEVHPLPPDGLSTVISALRGTHHERQSPRTEPRPLTRSGTSVGSHLYPTSELMTHSSPASTTKSRSLGFLPHGSATASFPVVVNRSKLNMFVTKSYTSRRTSPNWGPRTPASLPMAP
jgi:hypothetical protein